MNELSYLIYILVFIIGSILGLLISYKKHGEPFIINDIEIVSLIIAIIGWILLFNYGIISIIIGFISPEILISIGLFLIALVMGMRPGYGRKETFIGIIISALIWFGVYILI
ncbi:energy-converting hydrogenase subunit EhaL family protein [Methanobrevibacter sp.]|uniref:energy-converting hydrogenase subunit EhaL family protein n=1 Tax=Methanobrevibacter sp. TaxID=66852 RepID=UPI002615B0DC|nr:energy-converting hydrogenase subunit EhaL family protein [uncultured Methanobrevibacter sp.]